jgi:hypothetical protein
LNAEEHCPLEWLCWKLLSIENLNVPMKHVRRLFHFKVDDRMIRLITINTPNLTELILSIFCTLNLEYDNLTENTFVIIATHLKQLKSLSAGTNYHAIQSQNPSL